MLPLYLRRPWRACALAALSITLVASTATTPSRAQSELDAARDRLEQLQVDLEQVTAEYTDTQRAIANLDEAMRRTELQVRRIAKPMVAQEEAAVTLAQELYKGGSGIGVLQGVLGSETLADMNNGITYLEISGQKNVEVFERLAADSSRLTSRLELLEKARSQVGDAHTRVEALKDRLEEDVAAIEQEVAGIQEDARLAAERRAAAAAAAAATEVVASTPVPAPAPVPGPPYNADWDAIAMCESGGNWSINSTYDGGLQFHPLTWLGYGGGKYAQYAYQATREEQIAIAEKVLAGQGPGAWPNCFVEA